jgi:hypothetical protein
MIAGRRKKKDILLPRTHTPSRKGTKKSTRNKKERGEKALSLSFSS